MFSFEDKTLDLIRGCEAIRHARVLKGGVTIFVVEYHVEYILCVVSSDDSEIQQAYDRETDSILAMPIVSFFTTDKAQKVLVAIGRFRGQ